MCVCVCVCVCVYACMYAFIVPHGISKVYALFALAKQGKLLGAYKLARTAYTKLLSLRMPASWREQIDLACLTIRTKAYSDKEELLPVCYRCSTSNPLLNASGDACVNCAHVFVRSFVSFETLPLVEFVLEDGLTDEEADRIITEDIGTHTCMDVFLYACMYAQALLCVRVCVYVCVCVRTVTGATGKKSNTGKESLGDNGESLDLNAAGDDDDDGENADTDAFHQQLMNMEAIGNSYPPIRVNAACLSAMNKSEVFVVRYNTRALATRYYRSVIPGLPITFCAHCKHFFHEEDFEFHVLQKQQCPFCRVHVAPPVDEHAEIKD